MIFRCKHTTCSIFMFKHSSFQISSNAYIYNCIRLIRHDIYKAPLHDNNIYLLSFKTTSFFQIAAQGRNDVIIQINRVMAGFDPPSVTTQIHNTYFFFLAARSASSAMRYFTIFFTSAAGIFLSSGNCMAPLDVLYLVSSSANTTMGEAVG